MRVRTGVQRELIPPFLLIRGFGTVRYRLPVLIILNLIMKHKENILQLRSEGYSYNQIALNLGCSKATISFHCGKGQKVKVKARNEKRKKLNPTLHKTKKKISEFKNSKPVLHRNSSFNYVTSLRQRIYTKIVQFTDKKPLKMEDLTIETLLLKLKNNPKCSLTGRNIDVEDTGSWHLDHIIPKSKGGDNSASNCQIVCAEVNIAKAGSLEEDFINLCLDVLIHHGYKVIKPNP